MFNVDMPYIRAIYCVSYLLSALFSSDSTALEISPLKIELSADTKPTYQQIIVKNRSNRTVPIDVSLNRIIFNANGQKPSFTLSEDNDLDDLLVFPPALILKPGATQSVRVQWNRDSFLSESKSYFVRFSQPQLPSSVEYEDQTSGVKVFIHFNAVVHISSSQLSPNLTAITDSIEISKDGKQLTVDIINNGDKYHYLKQSNLVKLSSDQQLSFLLDTAQFEQLGEIFFPPNTVRVLSLPLRETWNKGDSLLFEDSTED